MDRNSLVYLLLVLLSAIFTYLTVVPRYFPHLGVGLTFIVLGTLIFGFKKEKRALDWLIFLIVLVLSFFIFFRANSFLTLLNVVTVFYLGSFLILGEEVLEGVLTLVLSPVMVVLQMSSVKNKFSFKTLPIGRISGWWISIILTFAVMVLIVPLLSYANPFFARLVSHLISLFNLREIRERFFQENFVLQILRGLIFLILVYLLPRWLTVVTSKTKKIGQIGRESFPISYLIPKLVLTVVLLIFFVTQAQLYFASEETLAGLGYTHSQYAREVFAHLSVVALVVFALIYNDKSKDKWSRGLTYFLLTEAFFLNLIALRSVYDYSLNWGFTHKRLYGFTGVIWVFGLLTFFAYKYWKGLKDSLFIRRMVVFSGLVILIVNFLNFDYLIYHVAKSTTQEGIDHAYLSLLSTDARSYQDHSLRLFRLIESSRDEVDPKNIYAAQRLLVKIESLREKYEKIDGRLFNFSEYFEYKKVRDLDLNIYQGILEARETRPSLYPAVPNIRIKH